MLRPTSHYEEEFVFKLSIPYSTSQPFSRFCLPLFSKANRVNIRQDDRQNGVSTNQEANHLNTQREGGAAGVGTVAGAMHPTELNTSSLTSLSTTSAPSKTSTSSVRRSMRYAVFDY
jgi:hypothetical protein